ncbi:2,3-diketo-5-methylthiopentyl-1-phosphate enolase [Cohnella thailandensis]|uniref:2,3-diketo-5-methylthiopentyl-1-phosphate enolase n=1 Tax=Cohnella thailandensis TaxID=557557 RepID=A0A841T6I6_9BACL|nr:2,3-diketo-5-methylthiopentyl-1-phosphate enolase [Cohnella thailandensis]MBB6636761.1 2,3-diketo-5-methylthiopentyl-1-phosphate enolase [Cohnella thailandensis]MBP1973363.1 2,3-diketo-5-methylthiopentyl-1-phosphate enolase [Cohnella thailandensis]
MSNNKSVAPGYSTATYRLFEDKADFAKKAEGIAVGLTVGSWTELPEVAKQKMEKYLGQVVSIEAHEPEGAAPGERYADITIAYPDLNFSKDLPALLVTTFGKLSMDGRIKLLDLNPSSDFLSAFSGPKFGMQGVREKLGITDRPLLMSIFKSVIGYDLPNLREQFLQQALGGVDLIKDDEILFENPLTPLEKRVETCVDAAREAEKVTGQKLIYFTNLTGPTSKLRENARRAIDAGANGLLFNVLSYGYDAMAELVADPSINVPIAAHPAMAGAFYPSPHHGIAAPLLLGKLIRIAGADLSLFPSPYGSVVMPKEENLAVQAALLDPSLPLKAAFPVPSAGIHPGLVPLIMRDFGEAVVVNAGGGVHGHAHGAAAGGRAFRQAIDAVKAGIGLADYATDHEELRLAIERWGVREA